jgi:ring-1,2-phenylacetyl-CoA epoxidase subunit PaaD
VSHTGTAAPGELEVWQALEQVPDPELPILSVVELGVVLDVTVEDGRATVRFTPTFVGCPAVEVMRSEMARAIRGLGLEPEVRTTFEEPWTSDRITPAGREKLAGAGIAPPGPAPVRTGLRIPLRQVATCPYCGSSETRLEGAFGPTSCRSVWYCDGCRQPFEGFKPV